MTRGTKMTVQVEMIVTEGWTAKDVELFVKRAIERMKSDKWIYGGVEVTNIEATEGEEGLRRFITGESR